MAFFQSVTRENFRRLIQLFFLSSCLLPVLIILFVAYQYVIPVMSARQLESLQAPFNLGLMSVVLIQVLGFFLLWYWTQSLERLTRRVTQMSDSLMANRKSAQPESVITSSRRNQNEIDVLYDAFETLNSELQEKISECNTHVFKLRQTSVKLSEIAVTDELTGLFNRRHFKEKLDAAVQDANSGGRSLWMARFEINGFDQQTDKNADVLLRIFGDLVRKSLPRQVEVFRFGRNEFAALAANLTDKQMLAMAERLTANVARYTFTDASGLSLGDVTICCGLAQLPSGGNKSMLFKIAGDALHDALFTRQSVSMAPA